ncbi:hypothetical protein TNCV_4633821 [Trichonephila clavipes]|nr:hypothetical protein TNCV_4633821 [Trichonephila clavipes]
MQVLPEKEVNYLGHIISAEGVFVRTPKKCRRKELKTPRKPPDARSPERNRKFGEDQMTDPDIKPPYRGYGVFQQ